MNLDNLFKRIEEKGLTLKQVSEDTGISAELLSEWKKGNRTPSVVSLKKIADYLNCSLDYLIGSSDMPNISGNIIDIYKNISSVLSFGVLVLESITGDIIRVPLNNTQCEAVKNLLELDVRRVGAQEYDVFCVDEESLKEKLHLIKDINTGKIKGSDK